MRGHAISSTLLMISTLEAALCWIDCVSPSVGVVQTQSDTLSFGNKQNFNF